jgi:hypothetical protein
MADWKVVRNDPDYPEPLDPEIVPLCDALNAAGFVTTSSCSGHGRDWPYVWFEHSTDARIEDLARFVLGTEGEYYRSHFTVWQKDDANFCAASRPAPETGRSRPRVSAGSVRFSRVTAPGGEYGDRIRSFLMHPLQPTLPGFR